MRAAVEEGEAPSPRALRGRSVRRVCIALGGLGVALTGVVWLERVPIATDFIDRELSRRNVAASYRIADLGPRTQRLTHVVIGDPAKPDLVADWVETRIAVGIAGPYIAGIRAGRVRMRARLADGTFSLGAIDRLLPSGSGGEKFTLPDIDAQIEDARVRLETDHVVLAAKISGNGRLSNGFRGTVAALGEEISANGCALTRPTAFVKIAIGRAGPQFTGPVRIARARCGPATFNLARANVDVLLGPSFDRWSGRVAVLVDAASGAGVHIANLGGNLDFAGTARRTEGRADLASSAFSLPSAMGERLGFKGNWRIVDGRPVIAGSAQARGMALDRVMLTRIASGAAAANGTPLGPIAQALAYAGEVAAQRFDVRAEAGLAGDGLLTLASLDAEAASGARLTFGDGAGIVLGAPAGMRINGVASISGGGFPAVRIAARQQAAGATLTGDATMAPYATRDARLSVTPIAFTRRRGGPISIRTIATLSGPLGDGRVENLRIPLTALVSAGDVALNPDCSPLAFDRLSTGGLALNQTRLTLCPTGTALFRSIGGRAAYGARIVTPRLVGRLGSSPLDLSASALTAGTTGFAAETVRVRLGEPSGQTTLNLGRLAGGFAGGDLAGSFASGSGQIGNVPLRLTDAVGRWRFGGSVLNIAGGLAVSDEAANARFRPLAARDVALRLADGVITATGALREPKKGVKVADVAIRHVLSSGAGDARLVVPGITFGKEFQPEELTPLTFGVIADVNGTVSGEGDISWNAGGVASTGTFRTAGIDLAAAFGPVTGIKGEIRFTDLLALESAPGQVMTVASINPGVPVNDGRVTYQTLANTRVRIEGARWPFAGGELTLDPGLLDFAAPEAHRLTFRVKGAEAAQFLQQFDFKNLDASGVFDGVLPIAFDQSGGRIEGGKLAVREGGGGIAYVGELTEKDLGTWGNIAFQALKSLRYRNLDIVMNGPLAGEMVTEVRFAGVSQGQGAKSNFLVRRLQKLPFVFNIRIKAPFRGLLDSVSSFYDPRRLIERNLPTLLEEQKKRAKPPMPVQPPASEKLP